ncbi:hypothetical protein [Syntrophaceticus schinkii]|uniref:hypothetical protein n=1 Tax=Syntrophaceticus schinkii TaxID=499207 RepID=UPI0012EC8A16|nr:hypothetical protein [Syntrophaceticus schinkii]
MPSSKNKHIIGIVDWLECFHKKKDQSFTALISLSNDDLSGFWQSIILSMPFLWQNSNK